MTATAGHKTPSRLAASTGATLLILAFVVGFLAVLVRRLMQLSSGQSLWLGDTVVGLWFVLVVMVAVGVLRQGRTPRRLWFLPTWGQNALRHVLEASAFGVGPLRGWTLTNPAADLRQLVQPEPPGPISPAAGPEPISAPHAATDHTRQRARPNRTPEARPHRPEPRPVVAISAHRVQRGETWWSLAERYLGEGKQWGAIRTLNLGREVEPGIVIDDDTVLRPGWQVQVPSAPAR